MKRILFAIAALLSVVVAAPASAQIYVTPNPGVGVVVGPLAVGVWPGLWGRNNWGPAYGTYGSYGSGYGYGSGCRVVRARTVRRHGTVVWRTRRVCY